MRPSGRRVSSHSGSTASTHPPSLTVSRISPGHSRRGPCRTSGPAPRGPARPRPGTPQGGRGPPPLQPRVRSRRPRSPRRAPGAPVPREGARSRPSRSRRRAPIQRSARSSRAGRAHPAAARRPRLAFRRRGTRCRRTGPSNASGRNGTRSGNRPARAPASASTRPRLRVAASRSMATVALPIARRATRLSLPLVGAFTVGAIAYGGLYTFPAISVAFAEEFGISRTLAVTPWTMFLVVTAVASPLLGRAYDEWADRDLLTASMVLLAAGWLAVYLARDISLVILAYAVFMALGLQLSFIGTSTAIARRYAGMSGLALGIAYAGPGIGVAIALPIAGGLIQTAGWRSASLVFLATCLVGVAFVWLMTSGPAIVVPARRPDRRRTLAPSDVRRRRRRCRSRGGACGRVDDRRASAPRDRRAAERGPA